MRRAVLSLILPALFLAPATVLLSCDGDPDFAGIIESTTFSDLAGVFLLKSEFGNAEQTFACSARGAATLAQAGSTLSGSLEQTGECQTPSGTRDISGTLPVAAGVISGSHVEFETQDCRYEGTIVGPGWEPSGASGEVQCTFVEDAAVVDVAGTWLVTFGAAYMTISPDPILVPLGGIASFSDQALDAAGEPVGGYADHEVSDTSVASLEGLQHDVRGRKVGETVLTVTHHPEYPLEEPVVAQATVKVVPVPPDVSGAYLFRTTFGNDEIDIACESEGVVSLEQSGLTLTGTVDRSGSCVHPSWTRDISGSTPISAARVVGTAIAFDTDNCHYEGTLVGDPASGAQGTMQCVLDVDSFPIPLEGEWIATLGAASVAILPSPLDVPWDGSVELEAVVRGPDGEVLTNYDLEWETGDSAVAQLSSAGRLTGVGPGSTVVRVRTVPRLPLEESVSGESGARVVLRLASIAAGTDHTCGLTLGGRPLCWGSNQDGRLGIGEDPSFATVPSEVLTEARFYTISAGTRHTCGTSRLRRAFCWGANASGQLGDGSNTSSAQPVSVWGDSRYRVVSAGGDATCGVTTYGEALCWGNNDDGRLGIGSSDDGSRSTPTPVVGEGGFETVSVGRAPPGEGVHVCALSFSGEAFCWGKGTSGELGDGSLESSSVPRAVEGGHGFATIAAGRDHTCAATYFGAGSEFGAYCWGEPSEGALGIDPLDAEYRNTPGRVADGEALTGVSAGDQFSCAIEGGLLSRAMCWGRGSFYQLGNGSAEALTAPEEVAGGLNLWSVTAGARHACGLTQEGIAYCWGANDFGQLGTGDMEPRATPTPVSLVGW